MGQHWGPHRSGGSRGGFIWVWGGVPWGVLWGRMGGSCWGGGRILGGPQGGIGGILWVWGGPMGSGDSMGDLRVLWGWGGPGGGFGGVPMGGEWENRGM